MEMETEEERRIRRRKRIEEMKREKRRTELLYRWGTVAVVVAAVAAGYGGIRGIVHYNRGVRQEAQEENNGVPGMQTAEPENGERIKGKDAFIQSYANRMTALTAQKDGTGKQTVDMLSETGFVGDWMAGGEPEAGAADGALAGTGEGTGDAPENGAGSSPEDEWVEAGSSGVVFSAAGNVNTVGFGENIISEYGVFIDVENGLIMAQKDAHARMSPASMTKILTVLVAAEHVGSADLDDKVKITREITDYCYVNGCSVTGYDVGEEVPVRDLFYGTILPSGADSALALANYVAGSQEAFVEMMNEKLAELGLAESSHFTNCVGLYHEDHYSTVYDIAVILETAVNNAFCREVLSAHTYTTSLTDQHPEGIVISNLFLRRIEDRDTHGEVLCGKTGFVNQSGSCAASFCLGNDGREYLCVTAGSTSSWNCIADQVELYQGFIQD